LIVERPFVQFEAKLDAILDNVQVKIVCVYYFDKRERFVCFVFAYETGIFQAFT
jgi:hypothetical protein